MPGSPRAKEASAKAAKAATSASAGPAATGSAGAAAAAPAGRATVSLQIRPWGEVFVDGVSRGSSPPIKSLSVDEGVRTIEVRNPGFAPYVRQLEVRRGERISLSHEFR
jgi:hypothetical protein